MRNWLSELQTSVLRGQNSGRAPGLIGFDQVWRAHNLSVRGGRLRSRSRWVRRAVVADGMPQGMTLFEHTGELLVSVGGVLYRVTPDAFTVAQLSDDDDPNSSTRLYAYFCETQQSVVIQDGSSFAWVYDGATFGRRDNIPVGTAMAYANGRLAVAIGRQLELGDIRQNGHQSELLFTETDFILGGGRIAFPDRIKALVHLPVLDTATGFGSLIVGMRNMTKAVRTEITERDAWASTPGFVPVIFNQHGIVGHDAHAQVNQDVYFRSGDGMRSLRATVADYSSPGSTPISREVSNRVDFDTEWLGTGMSCAYWDNRVFMTHSPYLLHNRRPIHVGVFSLNFDLVSELGAKAPAAFDGEWQGPPIVQLCAGMVKGERRMFALCVEHGTNTIWEFLPEKTWRLNDALDRWPEDAPEHVVETRVFYGADPRSLKWFRKLRFWFADMTGFVHFRVAFRAEGAADWTELDAFKFFAEAGTIFDLQPRQSREDIGTRTAPDGIDPLRQRAVNVGHGFQFRFTWCGDMRLDYWEVMTEPMPPNVSDDNPNEADGVDAMACPPELPDVPEVPDPEPEACEWALPTMAAFDTPLWVVASVVAGLSGETGGSGDRTNTRPIRCAMNEAGTIIGIGSSNSTTIRPKILVRNGATFDVFDLQWPADFHWDAPVHNNAAEFFSIDRNGAILGWYEATPDPEDPGTFDTRAIYWADRDAVPVVLTGIDINNLRVLSPRGAFILYQNTAAELVAYQKTPNGTEFVVGTETPFERYRGCNLCENRLLTDWAKLYTREADTDTWVIAETNLDHFLFDLSGDGLVAVGNDYGNAGLIFQGGQIVTPSVTLTQIDGEDRTEIFATRCSGDGAIVTGHYTNASFNRAAFIWDAANGARDLAGVVDANGLDRGGRHLLDVLWCSANGRHLLVSTTLTYGTDEIVYIVLDPLL